MSIKQLWAPWRMEFLKAGLPSSGCVFCGLLKEKEDRTSLILHRTDKVFVVLNKYPYNNGHLMVVPNKHTADLTELSPSEMSEMWTYSQHAVEALKKSYKPEGFNLGMNLGKSGGAGIREHLHLHIVPRWEGDTNFMAILADTKAMPQHLLSSYDELISYFRRLS
jgi:ATP adenylyltransferase